MEPVVDKGSISLSVRARELFGLELTEAHDEAFATLTALLIRWSQKINLTAITRSEEIAELHHLDSLSLASHLAPGASVIDVGTGAGFPTLPLAILRPDVRFRAIDSVGKKIQFVQTAAAQLRLSNVKAVHQRLEAALLDPERYDLAVSRALSAPEAWIERADGFLRPNGLIAVMLGARGLAAREEQRLQSRIQKRLEYRLARGERRELIILARTPDCPSDTT